MPVKPAFFVAAHYADMPLMAQQYLVASCHENSILPLMSLEALLPLIIEYRYLILLPLSFIEGPIIAFIAGMLANLGYFNLYVLAVFFLARDVSVDLACYYLG